MARLYAVNITGATKVVYWDSEDQLIHDITGIGTWTSGSDGPKTIHGTGDNDLWVGGAGGGSGSVPIYHYNGTSWAQHILTPPTAIGSVWIVGAIWAFSSNLVYAILHKNNSVSGSEVWRWSLLRLLS